MYIMIMGPVEKACPREGAGSASGVPCLRRAYSAEGYEGQERLHVYALKRFTAQACRQVGPLSCSRTPCTFRAPRVLRPCPRKDTS